MTKILDFENKGDDKGPVINLDFSNLHVVEIPVFYRDKDSNPEGHFHKGIDSSFDPQRIYVLKGSMEFKCIDSEGNHEVVVVKELQGIEIPKLIYHKYKTLEYTVFCEPRLEKYDIRNVDKHICSPEEFPDLILQFTNHE